MSRTHPRGIVSRAPGAIEIDKWDARFLALAEHIAGWSKDPSTKTGAVIIDRENRIVSTGYNGLARGVDDRPDRLNDRDLKYKIIVHCERNAIIFARQDLRGCRLYTWPFMSCATCAAMVIQAGIVEVVAPVSDNPRWAADFALSQEMFSEAGVMVRLVAAARRDERPGDAPAATANAGAAPGTGGADVTGARSNADATPESTL